VSRLRLMLLRLPMIIFLQIRLASSELPSGKDEWQSI
jgi:hypothetical protein